MNVTDPNDYISDISSKIVSAYVANNRMPWVELPKLIATINGTLTRLRSKQPSAPVKPQKPQMPAVPIEDSIHKEFIVCLEDGKRFRALKRHLNVHFGLTPDEYRAKWKLPANYPMVAPAYSARRSALAIEMGFGKRDSV